MRELSSIAGVVAAALLAAGCVSFGGSGLTPGKSTRADVES
jgi:hypothetical protein